MSILDTIQKNRENFIEKGADLEHDRWARWQKHMFSKMREVKMPGGQLTGEMILPKEFVDRWFRQVNTSYSELSEQEKESDRKETRNYLPLLLSSQLSLIRAVIEEVEKMKEDSFQRMGYTGEKIVRQQALSDLTSHLQEICNKLK
jgi:hypothetical protein